MRLRGLLLCLLASPVLAQDQLIPRELVDGLLASRGMRQAVIFVGELPREMVGRIYLPKGARILGGVSTGSGGTAILLSNTRREALLAELETELPKLGWKQFDPSQRMSFNSEFRDAPIAPGTMRIATGPQQFCGPNGGMMVNIEASGYSDSRITIVASDVNMCTAMAANMGPDRASEIAMRPTFINPPGARNDMTNCYRGGADTYNSSWGGSNMLNSMMTPEALIEAYSKQLTDSGWTAVNVVRASRAWTKVDSTGKKVQYTMTIEAPANLPNCRRVETQFARNSR